MVWHRPTGATLKRTGDRTLNGKSHALISKAREFGGSQVLSLPILAESSSQWQDFRLSSWESLCLSDKTTVEQMD